MPAIKRLRDLGLAIGEQPAGPTNTIADVPGVRVGHCSLRGPAQEGGRPIHTGVTAIVPGEGNLFAHPLPAAVDVFNGYGKSAGLMQIRERGQIETPLYLAGTLSVGRVWDAAATIALEQNPKAISANPVVLECNDGMLSDARGRHAGEKHVREALAAASAAAPALGSVGAGSGMKCMGYKGGIGSSSRVVATRSMGPVVVGVLSLNNFGGRPHWCRPLGSQPRGCHASPSFGEACVPGRDEHASAKNAEAWHPHPARRKTDAPRAPSAKDASPGPDPIGGSIIVVVATSAPLAPSVLRRLARRAWAGVARAGSSFSDTSGDVALAFALPGVSVGGPHGGSGVNGAGCCGDELRWQLPTEDANALFAAVADATEESIWDCLLAAGDFTAPDGKVTPGFKAEELLAAR